MVKRNAQTTKDTKVHEGKRSKTLPREFNYWLTTVQMPVPPAQPLPGKVDVAIIGAGFTGLSAAQALAKRGAKVAVLEAETIGWGASSRNGGMVLSGLKLRVNQLISKYGRELTQRMYSASLESIDAVERLVKEENIACDFARTGHLEVACKQAHFDDYARQAEVIAREFNHSAAGRRPRTASRRNRVPHLFRRHGRRSFGGAQSRKICCRACCRGYARGSADLRAHAIAEHPAGIA